MGGNNELQSSSDFFLLRPNISHSGEPLASYPKEVQRDHTTWVQTLNESFHSISVPLALSLCNIQVLLVPDPDESKEGRKVDRLLGREKRGT